MRTKILMSSLIFMGGLCTSTFVQASEGKGPIAQPKPEKKREPEPITDKEKNELSKALTATDIPNQQLLKQLTPAIPQEWVEVANPKDATKKWINRGCTNFQKLDKEDEDTKVLNKSNIMFIKFTDLRAGQISVAKETIENVAKDVAANVRQRGIGYIVKDRLIPCYNNGSSPFNEPFNVLKVKDVDGVKDLYVLTDGHHTVRGVINALRGTFNEFGFIKDNITIAVIPDRRFENMRINDPEFWVKAAEAGKVYIGDPAKTEENAKRVSQKGTQEYLGNMTIDEIPDSEIMRGFIEKVKAKCPTYAPGKEFKAVEYNKVNENKLRTAWYATQHTIPFVEYHLGKILKDYGFGYIPYQDIMEPYKGAKPDLVVQARDILLGEERKRISEGKPGIQEAFKIRIVVDPRVYRKPGLMTPEQTCKALYESKAAG